MNRNVSIVQATPPLTRSYWEALDQVARERKYLCFVEAPPFEHTEAFVGQIVEKGWTQFYGVEGDTVVGWCDIIPIEHEGFQHGGHLGMGVIPGYRGRGLGRRLIDASLAHAATRGLLRVELEVFASNEAAIGLYRKVGFVEEGRKRCARRIEGVCDDLIVMGLLMGELR